MLRLIAALSIVIVIGFFLAAFIAAQPVRPDRRFMAAPNISALEVHYAMSCERLYMYEIDTGESQ